MTLETEVVRRLRMLLAAIEAGELTSTEIERAFLSGAVAALDQVTAAQRRPES